MREDEVRGAALSLCPRVYNFDKAAVTSHSYFTHTEEEAATLAKLLLSGCKGLLW